MKIFIVNTDLKVPTRYFRKLSTVARSLGIPYSTLKKDFAGYKDGTNKESTVKRLKEGVVYIVEVIELE